MSTREGKEILFVDKEARDSWMAYLALCNVHEEEEKV